MHNPTLGIIGGDQLGSLLSVAAQKLNFIIKENMWKNKKYTKRKLVT